MRVVIPYRLSCDGLELRYAIRSMVKHFKPMTGVLLIGDRPEWYIGDHMPMADYKGEKERSMMAKLCAAPDTVCLYSNDDYFALEDFGLDLPYYHDHDCRWYAMNHKQSSYRAMYNNCDPNWPNYDVHTPMIMVLGRMRIAFQEMIAQTPIKTTYATSAGCPLPGKWFTDIKLRTKETPDEYLRMVKGSPFFSTHDAAISEGLIEFLDYLYPLKSKYECD